MKNEANGPADCLVTEMLQCLPRETLHEVTHWFEKRFKGECGKVLRLVFLKKPARRQASKRAAQFPRDRIAECVLQVVHDGFGGIAARGEGAD